ncbi:MAG: hypothetical protein WCV55_01540 [Candidatus Paceibacterota bacterium]
MTSLPSQYKYKKAFWILSASSACLIALYVVLIFQTVAHTVARKNTEASMQKLLSSISTTESNYIAMQSSLTPDLAFSRGFVEVKNTIVVRTTQKLSFRN